MILTVEEATTKMCPQTLGPVATADRVHYESSCCIGAECMAWRWNRDPAFKKGKDGNSVAVGYCGKAGQP
ncbi:hypothetical protein J6497_13105 [Bradyrhizobium sp. CNPSo 4026]|nr:hypothetical protein [Bradyrhizobium cenepequi]